MFGQLWHGSTETVALDNRPVGEGVVPGGAETDTSDNRTRLIQAITETDARDALTAGEGAVPGGAGSGRGGGGAHLLCSLLRPRRALRRPGTIFSSIYSKSNALECSRAVNMTLSGYVRQSSGHIRQPAVLCGGGAHLVGSLPRPRGALRRPGTVQNVLEQSVSHSPGRSEMFQSIQ